MTEKELMEKVEAKVGDVVSTQIKTALAENDDHIRGQMKEQIEEALAKITPTAEEKAVNEAAEEGGKKYKTFGEFLGLVHKARATGHVDERLDWLDSNGRLGKNPGPEVKVMTEGTDSAGGFLVPTEYRLPVLEIALENTIVRNAGAMVIPMASDSVRMPRVDDTNHTSSVFGGVIAYWTEETGTKTESQPKWGECQLNAHELSGYTVATNALLADAAIGLEAYIKRAFGEAWAWYEDVAFLAGTGAGQPLGITNAPCLVAVTRQANNLVYVRDFINLYGRMLPSSRGRAVWIMNHEVYTKVLEMSTSNTALSAGANFIWLSPDGGMKNTPPGTILGRPFYVTEKVPALGSASDLIFADLSYYLIGDRQALTIDASTHVYFTSNKTAWRFVLRCDGQPWLASALTPKNGTATLSPFVALSSTS